MELLAVKRKELVMDLIECVDNQVINFTEELVKRRVEKVCVEAGHIYVDESPNGQHCTSLKIGAIFADAISKVIPSVTKMLFVDDYNPEVSTLDLPEYLKTAAELGFAPDLIVREASLVEEAHRLVEKLGTNNATCVSSDGHTHTRQQNIRLRYVNDRLSCCALDATLYVRKFRDYDFNLTILPGESTCEYKKQQRNVRRLLRLLEIKDLPLVNVFFNENGSFTLSSL